MSLSFLFNLNHFHFFLLCRMQAQLSQISYVTSVCPILMLTSLGLASENMIRYISLHGQGLLELVGELVALF